MNETLPDFSTGAPLAARDLNTLAAHVHALQARLAPALAASSRPKRLIPRRGYAFQLSTMNGLIQYRQGWIQHQDGRLEAVGTQEWNTIAPLQECLILLIVDPEAESSRVELAPYDVSTPEKNFRRVLGYVRREVVERDGATLPLYHCVQCLHGLVHPYAPRRQAGTPDPRRGAGFRSSDWGLIYMHAGAITGEGYTVDGQDHRSAPILGYSCTLNQVELPAAHGGTSWLQGLSFECSI